MAENRAPDIIAAATIFTIITFVTVILRIYVRRCMLKTLGSDDWVLLVAQAFFTMYLICQYGGVVYGTGRHHEDLSLHDQEVALKYWMLCELFYIQATCWAKITIGLMLLRIATKKLHKWILYALMSGDILFCQIFFLVVALQCRPLKLFWQRMDQPTKGTCMNPTVIVNITYACSAVNSVADWTFAILPIFIIRELQMKKQARMLVAGVLALGAIASIATIIRIPYLHTLTHLDDFLYATVDVAIWSTVEVGLGLTAASLSTLRPLLRRLSTRFDTSSHDRLGSALDRPKSMSAAAGVAVRAPHSSWFVELDDAESSVGLALRDGSGSGNGSERGFVGAECVFGGEGGKTKKKWLGNKIWVSTDVNVREGRGEVVEVPCPVYRKAQG